MLFNILNTLLLCVAVYSYTDLAEPEVTRNNSSEVLQMDGICDAVVFSGCENTSQQALMGVKFGLTFEGEEPRMCDGSPVWSYDPIPTSLFTMSGMNGQEWLLGTSGRPCMPQTQYLMRSVPGVGTYTSDPSTSDTGLWQCWDESEGEGGGKWVDGLVVSCVSRT